jgi:hypothetical protein
MLMLAENKPIVFATEATRLPLRVERFRSFTQNCVRLAHPIIGPGRKPKKIQYIKYYRRQQQKSILFKNPIFLRGLYVLPLFWGGYF